MPCTHTSQRESQKVLRKTQMSKCPLKHSKRQNNHTAHFKLILYSGESRMDNTEESYRRFTNGNQLFRNMACELLAESVSHIDSFTLTQKLNGENWHITKWPSAGAGDPVNRASSVPQFHSGDIKDNWTWWKLHQSHGFHSRLPAWPCFLDQAKEQNPYVRQCNSLWSISIPVVADREEKKSTHAQTHRSDLRTGLSGWLGRGRDSQEWHRVSVHQNVIICVRTYVFTSCWFHWTVDTWEGVCIHSLFCIWACPLCVFV